MRAFALLAIGLLLLAGCSDPPAKKDSTSDSVFDNLGEDAEVTTTTGAIGGVVVDDAIRPLAGATVTLVSMDQTATTDDEGRFTFDGLDEGTYFLSADAERHNGAQVSVDVVAGEVASVRILLVGKTGALPYHTTVQMRGHIENWAGTVNFAVEIVQPGTLTCICSFDFVPDANLTTLIIEADGSVAVPNPGTPATVPGDAYYEVLEGNTQGGLIDSAYSEFPVYLNYGGEETLDRAANGFGVRLTCGVWPCVSADYDLYVTMFYHEAAPDDWSFLAGDV